MKWLNTNIRYFLYCKLFKNYITYTKRDKAKFDKKILDGKIALSKFCCIKESDEDVDHGAKELFKSIKDGTFYSSKEKGCLRKLPAYNKILIDFESKIGGDSGFLKCCYHAYYKRFEDYRREESLKGHYLNSENLHYLILEMIKEDLPRGLSIEDLTYKFEDFYD